MKAKRIATYHDYDDCWEQLADEYQNLDLDSFVARAKIIAPPIFSESPEIEDVIEDEILNQNENYILTWDDSLGECVMVYQKL